MTDAPITVSQLPTVMPDRASRMLRAKFPGGTMIEAPPADAGVPVHLLDEEAQKAIAEALELGDGQTHYTPAIGRVVCELVAAGYTLQTIGRIPGLPSRSTVRAWCTKFPDFAEGYRIAREFMADSLVDEFLDLARDATKMENQKRVRGIEVAIRAFQWAAERFNARLYANRGPAAFIVPIMVQTNLNLGQDGVEAAGVAGQVQNMDNPAVYSFKVKSRVVEDMGLPKEGEGKEEKGDAKTDWEEARETSRQLEAAKGGRTGGGRHAKGRPRSDKAARRRGNSKSGRKHGG